MTALKRVIGGGDPAHDTGNAPPTGDPRLARLRSMRRHSEEMMALTAEEVEAPARFASLGDRFKTYLNRQPSFAFRDNAVRAAAEAQRKAALGA